jgi:hypothetical protein
MTVDGSVRHADAHSPDDSMPVTIAVPTGTRQTREDAEQRALSL